MKKIIKEVLWIHDIPLLQFYKEEISNAPIIIFSHGFTNSKEYFKDEMEIYANLGFFVISIDNRGHGERKDIKFNEYVWDNGKLNILKIRQLINNTAFDIQKVINYYKRDPRINLERIAMIGVSMGGFITYRTVTIDDRINPAICLISSPEYYDFPKDAPLIDDLKSKKALYEFSQKNSPINFMEKYYNKNILIQIGENDTHLEKKKVYQFVEEIENKNQNGKIELIEYKNLSHEVTDEMYKKTREWINQYL